MSNSQGTENPKLLGKDGALLVIARNGFLSKVYKRYLLAGFHGRCNGTRAKKRPSPIPGSNIILGNPDEVVVIYQTECGRGPIEVISYLSRPDAGKALSDEVKSLLKQSGLPLCF